jgi:hypothetical protein
LPDTEEKCCIYQKFLSFSTRQGIKITARFYNNKPQETKHVKKTVFQKKITSGIVPVKECGKKHKKTAERNLHSGNK